MTSAVELLLKDIQNAIAARSLYPPEHPRTIESLNQIMRLVGDITTSRPDVSVFALDDKVVHEGEPIAGSEPIARGLFKTLRACGYDRLTIKRGLRREELDQFITILGELAKRADPASAASGPPKHPAVRVQGEVLAAVLT
jgi:hypothetical protein